MTPTSTATTVSTDALAELVATVADDFPAVGLQAGPADVQEARDELLPSDDALVLVVPTAGGPSRDLFVIVAPSLLASMGVTDPAAMPEAVQRTILELADGDPVDEANGRIDVGAPALEALPVHGTAPGATMVAAGVFAGVDHVATVGVAVHGDAPSSTDAPDAPDAMDLPSVSPTAAPTAAPASSGTAASRLPGGRGLDILGGVQMSVVAELGRTRMTVAELLTLAPGSVVELDRAAGTPIDLLVNGTLIARGEVVVVDEEFGLRITDIVDGTEGH